MNLSVALSPASAAWKQALEQEKVSYRVLNALSELDPESYPVAVLTQRPSLQELSDWRKYLHGGGRLVTTEEAGRTLSGRFSDRILLVEDPSEMQASLGRYREKEFYFEKDRFVTEVAASLPAGRWRRAFVAALQKAFWSLGLPYVRLSYYPAAYDGLFCFRMDFDNFIEEDFNNTCGLIKRYPGIVSCFVNMKSFEGKAREVRRLSDGAGTIGSHGYIHHVYDRYAQNRWNVERAEELLKQCGVSTRGFSAPHGLWNPLLQRVLEEKNYSYSSEFTLNYDDLPFFPVVHGKASSVLQVPTHPVCEGVFMERYGFDESMITGYYSKVISEKMAAFEPALIFGHPDGRIGRHPQIFHQLMTEVGRWPHSWKTDLDSWTEWWRDRSSWTFDLAWEDGLKTRSFPADPRASLEFFFPNRSRLKLKAAELVTALPEKELLKRASRIEPVVSFVRERSARLSPWKRAKGWIKKWLDWETKTPAKDYLLHGPRDWVRFFLRKVFAGA